MIEYRKIETVFERDKVTHKVKPGVFKNATHALLKRWHWTEKIDGTNIRIGWEDGKVRIGGRTENAQIPLGIINFIQDLHLEDALKVMFQAANVVIFGEGYGAGIQRGASYSATKRFVAFDVLVADKWWLRWDDVVDVCTKLGLESVPSLGYYDLKWATDLVRVGFLSYLATTANAEGLVGRPEETLFDARGDRLIIKLKTRDF
ncbi:hypothetical protein LCGC14_1711050 [marine sediment metagenome]|uniref:RNA ligase domain-containing protein n=1 Tax=marine sediment metagenome TaxID=412755 RepID=A0A0F9HER8_9ZZZZ